MENGNVSVSSCVITNILTSFTLGKMPIDAGTAQKAVNLIYDRVGKDNGCNNGVYNGIRDLQETISNVQGKTYEPWSNYDIINTYFNRDFESRIIEFTDAANAGEEFRNAISINILSEAYACELLIDTYFKDSFIPELPSSAKRKFGP